MDHDRLHARWDELESDSPMDGVVRRRVVSEQMMISHVRLARGTVLPSHAHENEQMAIVLEGRVRFGIGEPGSEEYVQVDVSSGGVLRLPAWMPHSAEALEDALVLDAFSPPSEKTGLDAAHDT